MKKRKKKKYNTQSSWILPHTRRKQIESIKEKK